MYFAIYKFDKSLLWFNYLSSFNFDKVSFCWLVGSCYLGIVLFMEERYAQTWVERMLIQCRLIKLGPASMLWYSVYNSPTLCQSIWALFFGVVQHIKKSLCFTHKKVYIDLKQDFFQSKSKVRPCKILVQVIYIFSHPASISKRCVMTLNYFSGQTWRS